MDGTASFGILVSFTAGLLSFLSPCVLPLIPSYVTFITGLGLEDAARARRTAVVHALLFVLGFSLIFIALGATATVLGRVLLAYRGVLSRVGGLLIILFGLYTLGAVRLGALSVERRVHLADKPVGYLGTVLVGVAFGAGWTPCIGPILGSILLYTSSAADLRQGVLLLATYSLGLAVPFLVAAAFVPRFLAFFARARGRLVWFTRAAGVLMVLVGVLLVTDYFTLLAGWLQGLTPDFLKNRL
jgi:cytochrome c-type biogenesis protein